MGQIVLSVTAEQVAVWEKEIEEITARQEQDAKRLQILSQRIATLKLHLFDDDAVQRTVSTEKGKVPAQEGILALTPPSLVLRLLENQGGEWTTIGDLKTKIRGAGYPEKRFGPEYRYLYSLLPRLVKSGKIKKDGNKLMLLPKRTPVLPGVTP